MTAENFEDETAQRKYILPNDSWDSTKNAYMFNFSSNKTQQTDLSDLFIKLYMYGVNLLKIFAAYSRC